jgi:hypothetical protein
MAGPLDGFRIVDFGCAATAPYAALVLGELGAEVIKIEPLEVNFDRKAGGPNRVGRAGYGAGSSIGADPERRRGPCPRASAGTRHAHRMGVTSRGHHSISHSAHDLQSGHRCSDLLAGFPRVDSLKEIRWEPARVRKLVANGQITTTDRERSEHGTD